MPRAPRGSTWGRDVDAIRLEEARWLARTATAAGLLLALAAPAPGETSLRYSWTAPYAASFGGTTSVYVLTVQKQPGRQADGLDVSITVPPGASITEASGGLTIAGRTATLHTTLAEDVVVAVRYEMTP